MKLAGVGADCPPPILSQFIGYNSPWELTKERPCSLSGVKLDGDSLVRRKEEYEI